VNFRFYPLRFSFVAKDQIFFPPGKSSNILRGAFGNLLREVACSPECPGARECEFRRTCPYATMFEPRASLPGPSGLSDWPRPFVFRATHLDGITVAPGTPFYFDFNYFDVRNPGSIGLLTEAFSRLGMAGIGPGRGRAELIQAPDSAPLRLVVPLTAPPVAVSKAVVSFLTPTELKSGEGLVDMPLFGVLAARIRDRISILRSLYDEGPLPIDFRRFGERARKVTIARCNLKNLAVARRSSRTGQTHPIGGFVGEVEYEGALTEFIPYLQAAHWTGVGRQTVWGKGEIEVRF
jgi:hypothetical protein